MRKTGTEVVRCSSVGHLQRRSIPGYAGFVPGRVAEDIHGATFREASLQAEKACTLRGRRAPGPDTLELDGRSWRAGSIGTITAGSRPRTLAPASHAGTIDLGSSNASVGASGDAKSVPFCQVPSVFHNPRGHGVRAGAAVPGYVGFIPGKVAEGVFATGFAQDNLKATQLRREKHQVADTQHLPRTPASLQAGDAGAWKRWNPAATRDWLRY